VRHAAPIAVAVRICATAPGSAIARTDIRSLIEKCSPTPNISRITPISASWCGEAAVADESGVKGPRDAGQQVADDGRHAQDVGHQSQQ
jgi:hypothetical protein